MKAKISFVSGAVLGLLAGSRIGPQLYRRVASAVSSAASSPRLRKGASSAGDRAAHVAKNAGASAAHQVKHAGEAVAHRFGDRWGAMSHSHSHAHSDSHAQAATNGSSHSTTGRFDDESLGE